MKRTGKIALALGAALSLGLAAATVSAQSFGPGWGGWHMGGYGPGYGMMGGYGGGPGWRMGGYGPGYAMGPWMMGGYGPGYGMGPRAMFGGFYGNVDDNLAALKTQLGITAKQDAAWQAFAKSAKQQNEHRQAWFAKMQQARIAGSAPEFLAQQAEFVKQREADLEAHAAALKSLYAALTPEQRAAADQRFDGYSGFGGFGPRHCLQAWGGAGPGVR